MGREGPQFPPLEHPIVLENIGHSPFWLAEDRSGQAEEFLATHGDVETFSVHAVNQDSSDKVRVNTGEVSATILFCCGGPVDSNEFVERSHTQTNGGPVNHSASTSVVTFEK